MTPPHRNAPLTVEGRRRLIERCRTRPIAHVAAEMGISRACASKWVNRWRRHGDLGLLDRPSTPHHIPRATPAWVIEKIESWRRQEKWSAQRITHELAELGYTVNRRTVTRHLTRLGLGRRRFLDPCGDNNRAPGKITARWLGHMVHLDVKKVGRIPDGGGWRVHGRDSEQAKAASRAKTAGSKRGYVYLHSAIDGFSRLAYTEPLADEKGSTAAAFLARAKVWFAAHGITHLHRVVTDNGACYRSRDFARIISNRTRHQKTKPYTPRHNGKVERYQRVMSEELLYAREFTSEDDRAVALSTWNIHYNYHRPHSGTGGVPPAAVPRLGVTCCALSGVRVGAGQVGEVVHRELPTASTAVEQVEVGVFATALDGVELPVLKTREDVDPSR
jgi:transposase InsO family protein